MCGEECVMTDVQATYQPPEPPHIPITIDAYLETLDKHTAEVVNGELLIMHPPQLGHVVLAHRLYDSLKPHVARQQLGEVIIEAPYLLEADDRTNWVENAHISDVSFVNASQINAHIAKYGWNGPIRLVPELAIEIVSPSDKFKDVVEKVKRYLHYGVKLVFVIEPELRIALVYSPENPNGNQLTDADTLTAEPVVPGWSIPLANVFGPKA